MKAPPRSRQSFVDRQRAAKDAQATLAAHIGILRTSVLTPAARRESLNHLDRLADAVRKWKVDPGTRREMLGKLAVFARKVSRG